MKITPNGARATLPANPDYFTGQVWQDPVVSAPEPARLNALVVHFAPGARTAWHTHPLGQTLYVLSGTGRIGKRGEAPQIIRAGDTVWIEPNLEHWHGAAPDTGMTHMAMQEVEDGSAATWLEHVSDADFTLAPA